MILRERVPLALLTTFRVGGPARWFAEAVTVDDVRRAADEAVRLKLPLFVLGGGSNLLVSDEGFDGVVLRIGLRGVADDPPGDDAATHAVITAAAGEPWDDFVAGAVERGLGGVECLSGIPGTVGGTPIQNVGAYGQEAGPVIRAVRALDRLTGVVVDMTNADCAFRYRASRFNTTDRDRWIVLQVTYALPRSAAPNVTYRDLARLVAGRSAPPGLAEVRAAVREIRRTKGMLLEPGDPDCRSAGSFFKNPVISEAAYDRAAGLAGGELPRFEGDAPGFVKVPAARLIELAGFARGYERGGAAISSKHSLALINRANASAADIVALARAIRDGVRAMFGVELRPEPVLVGFRDEI